MLIRSSILYLALLMASLSIGGCDIAIKKDNDVAANAITAAKKANKRAIDEKYEWRDTGILIRQAEFAQANGDNVKATKLANKARRQAENAVKQKYSELKRLKHMLGGN